VKYEELRRGNTRKQQVRKLIRQIDFFTIWVQMQGTVLKLTR
jgi:hypothetical protein